MSMKNRNEDGFTGLEAAIVLIAFVVVAAVFSYVVLGAGFFTTQKSQQVVHAGVTQAASNILVKGNVYGLSNDSLSIQTIQFDIGLAAGGIPIDVTKVVYTFSQPGIPPRNYDQSLVLPPTLPVVGTWRIVGQSSNNPGNLLKEGSYYSVQLTPNASLQSRGTFTLEVKPENGAALGLDRNIPAGITNTTILY